MAGISHFNPLTAGGPNADTLKLADDASPGGAPRRPKAMDKHFLGDVRITRIQERDPILEPILGFFPELTADVVGVHEPWLAPEHYDPGSRCMLLHFHSWIVRTRHHTMLVDTCNGDHKSRPGLARLHNLETGYLERLRAAGVAPEEVDFVFCTHLHVDHVGWNTRLDKGRWVPTFPNAKYLMSRQEHDTWSTRSTDMAQPQWQRNVYIDSVLPVVERGLAHLLDGTHEVDDNFTIRPAPGHTPGTCRADVRSHGKHASFCGDILHSPLQVLHWEINSRTCEDKARARESRHESLSFCAGNNALVLPMHFGPPYATRIGHAPNDRFRLDWVE
jgi:glyoxylase-like metal-dependent hydrolase (beta-lactamase superfamily II)